ncbi:MAG TPA: hypothetical protein VE397_18295 [Stellaceae bacterium]|nr:hypothetical protein [Stellaceae bacterium]
MVVARTLFCAALLLSLALATEARALCRDDLPDVKERIDGTKAANPQRYGLALKWWGRAQEAQPGSEVECLNFLAQARKALADPLPTPACTSPNPDLPNCNGDGPNGMGFAQVVPVGPVQSLGGAGVGAVFNSQGSPGAGNNGTEATATDR